MANQVNQFDSNYLESDGSDLGNKFVTKAYMMEIYPYLTGLGDMQFGALWTTGVNTLVGALGDGTTASKSFLVQTLSTGSTWRYCAAGGPDNSSNQSVAAIKNDGTLWMWGFNTSGQLGTNDIAHRSSPAQTVATGTNWVQVDVSSNNAAGVKSDGTLWIWGNGTIGRLGNNDSTFTHRSSPVQTVATGTNWKQVSISPNHTAAVKTDGTLWLWGSGTNGLLGNNDSTFTHRSSPVQTVATGTNWKQVAASFDRTAAIKIDGTLWLWGTSTAGTLGDGSGIPQSSPVQIVTSGNNWKQVSAAKGSTYTFCGAIKTDGTLWVWGRGAAGNAFLGGPRLDRISPVQTLHYGADWKFINCGANNMVAIKTNGTLWGWGFNAFGELGTGNTATQVSSPVQTAARGTNWKMAAMGGPIMVAIQEAGDDF